MRFQAAPYTYGLSFAPDPRGELLVIASDAGTIQIWDAAGILVSSIDEYDNGRFAEGHSVAWSPDGDRFVVGNRFGEIYLFDRHGTQLHEYYVRTDDGQAWFEWIDFAGPNRVVATNSIGDTVFLNLATGGAVVHRYFPEASEVRSTSNGDGTTFVWELAYRRYTSELPLLVGANGGRRRQIDLPYTVAARFSPSGERLVALLTDGELVEIDVRSGRTTQIASVSTRQLTEAPIERIGSRRHVSHLSIRYPRFIDMRFDREDQIQIMYVPSQQQPSVVVDHVDLSTGGLTSVRVPTPGELSLTFGALLRHGDGAVFHTYSFGLGQIILREDGSRVSRIGFDAAGYVAADFTDTGHDIRVHRPGAISDAVFHAETLSMSIVEDVRLDLPVVSSDPTAPRDGWFSYFAHQMPNWDGSFELTTSQDRFQLEDSRGSTVWDVPNPIPNHIGEHGGVHGRINAVALDSAGEHAIVVSSADDDMTRIVDIDADGRVQANRLLSVSTNVTWASFSRDDTLLALSDVENDAIYILDVQRLRVIDSVTVGVKPHRISLSADNRYAVYSSASSFGVWDRETDNLLTVRMIGDDWVMHTQDNYFAATRDGSRLVALTRNLEGYALDQLALTHNRPDLILERMGWGAPETRTAFRAAWERRLRRAGFDPATGLDTPDLPRARIASLESDAGMAWVTAEFAADEHDLAHYNIFVNDVPLFGPDGKPIDGRTATITEAFALVPGRNKIEVSCTNTRAAESLRAVTYAENLESTNSTLYFVGIGVSDYADDRLDLAYAAQDAADLAQTFLSMEGRTQSTATVSVTTLLDDEVTPSALDRIADTLRGASAADTVVLFVAGHGMYSRDEAPTYYFLPHTADVSDLAGSCISFESIERLLIDTPARHRLLLLDTCESGELDPAVDTVVAERASSSGLAARAVRGLSVIDTTPEHATPDHQSGAVVTARTYLLDRDRFVFNDLLRRSGAIVFSASAATEYSYEDDRYQNGLFTQALLDALSSESADLDADGQVSADELRGVVTDWVSQASNGLQHPTVDRDNIYQQIAFPVVP